MRWFLWFLYEWLLESDLPVALQVFWKLLCLGMAVTCFVAPATQATPAGVFEWAVMATLGTVMALACLFTKLGDG